MKNTLTLFLLALLLPFFGCQENSSGDKAGDEAGMSPQQEEEINLRDGIFVVHDEAMARMGEIHRLKKELRNILRNVSSPLDTDAREKVSQVLVHLDKADNGMMSWMASFKQPNSLRQQMSHDEIMAYMKAEKVKVDAVKTDIEESITAATALLGELKKQE